MLCRVRHKHSPSNRRIVHGRKNDASMTPASIQTQASGAIQRRRQSVDAEVSDHIHLIHRQAYWHCGTRPFRIRTLTARPEESTAALATGSTNAFLFRPVRIVFRRFHSLLRSLQRNYSGWIPAALRVRKRSYELARKEDRARNYECAPSPTLWDGCRHPVGEAVFYC